MRERDIILNIAGLPLSINSCRISSLPKSFGFFLDRSGSFRRPRRHFDYSAKGMPKISGARLICYTYSQILALNQGALLHASAVIKGRNAFLFFAHSGGGKSTIANLSRKFCVIGDDVVAVRRIAKKFYAFPTPWIQEGFVSLERENSAGVAAAFFIKKSSRVSIRRILPEEALVRILRGQVHFLSHTPGIAAKDIFYTVSDFVKRVPCYEMGFTRKADPWPKIEEALRRT